MTKLFRFLNKTEITSQTLSSTWDSLTNPLLIEDVFAKNLRRVYRHVFTMFKDMFTLCLQTYLHNVYRHVYSMLENMSRHAYTMLEDIFTLCLKSSLHQVFRHVHRIAMSELMFTPSLKTCLQHVWTHTYTKLKTYLHIF